MLGSMSSRTGGELRSALLVDAAELTPLESEWRRLAEERANVFLTPEWFSTWLRHYDEYAPAVPVVTQGDSLLGLVPLVRARRGRPRRIQFAGENAGDYFHPVATESDERPVAAAAARALHLGRQGYNTLVLENVDPDAAWWREIARESPRSITAKRVKGSVLPYNRGEDSAAADPRLRRFLADLAAVTLERGWLRLWMLELDGEPVAARLEWLFGTRLASYYTGFDPRLDREGVGFLLVLVPSAHPARLLVSVEVGMRRGLDRLSPRARRRARGIARPLRALLPTARR
jgi:CelD/BcsL family acetyltransferase involved in cellulose biosynthesis